MNWITYKKKKNLVRVKKIVREKKKKVGSTVL